jgi:tetratricopeptide (TPR) repeat protein
MKTMFLNHVSNALKKAVAFAAIVLFYGQLAAQTPELNDARRLIENEQYSQAIAKLNSYIALNPKDERADYLMGKAYFLSEKYNDASAWFGKGMSHSGRFPMNFVGAGAVEVVHDNFDGAKAKLTEAGTLNKDNDPVVLLAMAEAYMGYTGKDRNRQKSYLNEAEPLLYKVQKLDPNNARSFVLMGILYGLQGVEELEQSAYENAIQRDAKLKEAYVRLGQLYKKQKKYSEAAEMFQKAIDLDNGYAPPIREMAEMWFMAKKYDKAQEFMDKYLAIMGNDKGAKMRSCIFQYAGEQYEQSIPCMENMLKDTSSVLLIRLLGYSYVKKTGPDADKALMYLDRFFKEAPATLIIPSDYEMKAKALALKGQTDEAVVNFEKSMKLASEDPTAEKTNATYLVIADMYKEKKDYVNRAVYIEKFLAGEKTYNLKESFNLGNTYYLAQNFIKADSIFKIMTEQKPDIHVGFIWRGKANMQLDPDSKLGLAKPHLEKAKEMIGSDEEKKSKFKDDYLLCIKYLAAYFTLVANDCATARPFYDEILLLKPDDEQALNGMKYCKY